jgi:hypothetical protein
MDLRAVNNAQFLDAKRFWAAAMFAKLVVFAMGLVGVLAVNPTAYLPQLVLIVAVASELLQLRSDGLKARAESLLRKLDLCRSLGQEVSDNDLRDIAYTVPHRIRHRFRSSEGPDTYFASASDRGPVRAIENLHESAWYNGRQAGAMAAIYGSGIAVLVVTSIAVLIMAMRESEVGGQQERLVRVVTAWLMLVISLNMLKAAWSYFRIHQRCDRTVEATLRLSKTSISETDALRQWHEYQVARSSCPLMPQWLWKMLETSLNDAWASAVRARQDPGDAATG